MAQEENKRQIPFGKAARVGNYKIWRSKFQLVSTPTDEQRKQVREESAGRRKAVPSKTYIEVINVSNLDGSWKVQIPQTMMMFATVCQGFAVEDDERREEFLRSLFTGFYNITTNSSVALHDSLMFLTEMLSFPYLLLPENEMKKRMEAGMKESGVSKEQRKDQIGRMVEYRRGLYDLIEKKKAAFLDEYERTRAMQREYERLSEEEDMKHEELAEQAAEVLEKNDE